MVEGNVLMGFEAGLDEACWFDVICGDETSQLVLGGGSNIFYFHPYIPGEMIQFD